MMIAAFGCALVGAGWDVATRRIPNWLTYSCLVGGLVFRACVGGWHGVWYGIAGALVGGGIFLVFFLVHGMGAGDVKLMAAVGCLAGLGQVAMIVLTSAIAGGVLAFAFMVFHRRVGHTLGNTWELIRYHLVFGAQSHPEINLQNPEAIRMPYALAIAAGTFYSLGAMLLWR